MSDTFIVVIGISVVFIGLICLVLLCKIIGLLTAIGTKKEADVVAPAPIKTNISQPIENRQEIIAAVSAAVAEELGTDVSAIRILSFKKI